MRAKLRAEYNRTLDCFLGVLMLFPASDLTKANVDLLPSKASKRGPGSRSSRSSKSSLPGRFLEEFRLQKPRESSHNPMDKSSMSWPGGSGKSGSILALHKSLVTL